MKPAAKRLSAQAGYTLAEALITLLIVGLTLSVATVGIPAAQNAYRSITDRANAQILLNTTVTELRERLSVSVPDEETTLSGCVCYEHPEFGLSKIRILDTSGALTLNEHLEYDTAVISDELKKDLAPYQADHALVSKEAGDVGDPALIGSREREARLKVTCGGIDLSGSLVTFTDLRVTGDKGQSILCLPELLVRMREG